MPKIWKLLFCIWKNWIYRWFFEQFLLFRPLQRPKETAWIAKKDILKFNWNLAQWSETMIIIYSELSIKKRVKSTTFFFLNLIVNEDKKQVIDDKVQSEVQLNKEQNMNKSNNKADVDEDFQIDITTTKDVSCMNQNNYISADSLKRFQEWKPGLCDKECWINDEVTYKAI